MQLSNETVSILKNFSAINTNLVINSGNKIETIAPSKDIIASYEGVDNFSETVSIFNLNEFLGVLGAFSTPELSLNKKFMNISSGKQRVQYNYADSSLLICPPAKGITFPTVDVSFELSEKSLDILQKMSGILSAPDFTVLGDGKTVTLKVFDKKNSATNDFELEGVADTKMVFQTNFKIQKLKLFPGDYTVDIHSNKISRFTHSTLKLTYLIAIETDSTIN